MIFYHKDYDKCVWRGCKTDVRTAILDELRIYHPLGYDSSEKRKYN
ncbi:MAG: hypothetical protein KGD63_09060 [Candidatus Lokiarchaeota archaeon]|nr:hypothetical protein [Candidatus Lokiarchaeota archaeon]